jgi:PIN domain nuclease of toxin-antitoxin system
MRLLLDTRLLLWAVAKPQRLDATTRAVLEDPGNEVLFSAASLWEIAIKAGLGRPDFAFDPRQILQAALETGLSNCRCAPTPRSGSRIFFRTTVIPLADC